MNNSAAFFDLDRTLMSGSSAFYFGRAAYREGLLPLPRLVADGLNGLAFKLFGASDEKSEQLRDRILESVAGDGSRDAAPPGTRRDRGAAGQDPPGGAGAARHARRGRA